MKSGRVAYIAIWLEHHGNRLYGFMGLLSKMSDWMERSGLDWIPLRDCYDYYTAPAVLTNQLQPPWKSKKENFGDMHLLIYLYLSKQTFW